MPRPRRQQDRGGQLGTVEDRVAVEHRDRVLGQEVGPVVDAEGVGRRHAEPAAGCIPVGEHEDASVAADLEPGLRVHVDLHRPQVGLFPRRAGQVGEEEVVARGGAFRGRHLEPSPVAADGHAVVLGVLAALAEDQHVLSRVGADPVQPDATVELVLTGRDELGCQPSDVVVGLGAGEPGHRGVARPVDRSVDLGARDDVDDPQDGLLRAALGHLVGQEVSLLGRLPGVERGETAGVEGHGVDERALGAVRVDGQQHRVLLLGRTAHEELAVPAPDRCGHDARVEELADARAKPVLPGPGRAFGGEQAVLGRGPLLGVRRVSILEPPVGVAHGVPEQVFDDVEPGGLAGSPDGWWRGS